MRALTHCSPRCDGFTRTRWPSTCSRSTRLSRSSGFRCAPLHRWVRFLSAIALALSISGLYGVLTYTFGQRIREIGIRMALGASPPDVTRLVVGYSARLASLGTATGLLLGFTVMKLLSRVVRLDNVSVIDPGAFAVSVALVAAAVALASYGPARRAARVDPSSMLRAD